MPFRLLRLSALCVASASLLVGQQVSAQMDFPFEGNWVNPKTGGEGRIVWNSEENRYDILLIRPGASNVPASCNNSKPGDVTSYIIPSKIEGGNPVFVYSWCKWNKDRVVTSRTWRKGRVFLRRSNSNLIVTSIGRYERVGSLASDGGYTQKPLAGRRRRGIGFPGNNRSGERDGARDTSRRDGKNRVSDSPLLPTSYLGNNRRERNNRVNSDLEGGGTAARKLFRKLTDGIYTREGNQFVGANGVRLRIAPAPDGRYRVDIPARGHRLHETIHFNK